MLAASRAQSAAAAAAADAATAAAAAAQADAAERLRVSREEWAAWRVRVRGMLEAKDAELDAARGAASGQPAGSGVVASSPPRLTVAVRAAAVRLPDELPEAQPSSLPGPALPPPSPALPPPSPQSPPPPGDAQGTEEWLYLQNVFRKLLASTDADVRRRLLLVMATVLRLSPAETRRLSAR
jgi:hypothetical protein